MHCARLSLRSQCKGERVGFNTRRERTTALASAHFPHAWTRDFADESPSVALLAAKYELRAWDNDI